MKSARVGQVRAEVMYINSNGNIEGRKEFTLEEGRNRIHYCNFHEFKGNIVSVKIRLKEYPVSFSSKLIKID